MNFQQLGLEGAWLVTIEPNEDDRGYFGRLWSAAEFGRRGLETAFVESSLSLNAMSGTLRGLHFQRHPHEEVRLVTCVRGSIWDVVVDLRADSSTFGRWEARELSASNLCSMYVPKGFAHGYQTLEDDTLVLYNISSAFDRDASSGVAWDDPTVGIRWPATGRRTISARDQSHPPLEVARLLAISEPHRADMLTKP